MKKGNFFRRVKSSLQLFWRRFGGAIVALTILSVLGVIMFNLNLFFVQNFDVTSFDDEELSNIDSEEVEDFLVSYIGKRIFEVDTREIEVKLQEEYSYIRDVYVSKRVPNSLQIRIIERIPTLIITNKSIDYLLDDDGQILEDCSIEGTKCSVKIKINVSYYSGDIEIGDKPFITELDESIVLTQNQDKLGSAITEILIPESDVIYLTLEDSTRAFFTTQEDIVSQIGLYSYTRENLMLKGEKFKEIDMRFERPVIRVDKYTY